MRDSFIYDRKCYKNVLVTPKFYIVIPIHFLYKLQNRYNYLKILLFSSLLIVRSLNCSTTSILIWKVT